MSSTSRDLSPKKNHSLSPKKNHSPNHSEKDSLGAALKDSGDFFFDMSDRWQSAYLGALKDPIFPPEERRSPPTRVSSFMQKVMTNKGAFRESQQTEESQQRRWTVSSFKAK
jgi:hypothetical protein